MVGRIYLAKIYFTDLSSYKIRPVLIIKELDKNDIICLQLSSQFKKDRLIITNNDLTDGKLKKDSIVVIPKNFTLNKDILIKYVGKIFNKKLEIIYNQFCNDMGCKNE